MKHGICTAPGCGRVTAGGRYCSMHYRRLAKHGSLDQPGRLSPEERFWTKVDKTTTCWLWTSYRSPSGYGSFFHSRPDRLRLAAHRFAYEQLVGPIPDGLDIDHLCRVRHCVNPAHLEPVTRKVNTLRGVGPTATNATKTQCLQGHPYDDANTYVHRSSGQRKCRACNRERQAKRDQEKRQKAVGRGEYSGAA